MKNSIPFSPRNFQVFVALIMLFFFAVSTSMAQIGQPAKTHEKTTPEDRAKQQTERMKADLKLNPAQEPLVYAVNLKYEKKNEDARKKTPKDQYKQVVQKNNADRRNELKKILTTEQINLYIKKRDEMKAKQAREHNQP